LKRDFPLRQAKRFAGLRSSFFPSGRGAISRRHSPLSSFFSSASSFFLPCSGRSGYRSVDLSLLVTPFFPSLIPIVEIRTMIGTPLTFLLLFSNQPSPLDQAQEAHDCPSLLPRGRQIRLPLPLFSFPFFKSPFFPEESARTRKNTRRPSFFLARKSDMRDKESGLLFPPPPPLFLSSSETRLFPLPS